MRANLSLNSIVGSPPAWLRHLESEMREALAKAGVRMVDIQRRAKHVAGVHRKMVELPPRVFRAGQDHASSFPQEPAVHVVPELLGLALELG